MESRPPSITPPDPRLSSPYAVVQRYFQTHSPSPASYPSTQTWLITPPTTPESEPFWTLYHQRLQSLHQYQEEHGRSPHVLLAEPNPIPFLASFLAACVAETPLFLANPHWAPGEWQSVLPHIQPTLIWSPTPLPISPHSSTPPTPPNNFPNSLAQGDRPLFPKGTIHIPTGGTSGQIRFAIHTWTTLMAAVQGFQQHFHTHPVNAYCVLPLHHVSGLMQFLRVFTSGGQLVIAPFSTLLDAKTTIAPTQPLSTFFLSLVPTQLHRLLQANRHPWLSQFQTVLLGGGPPWPQLLDQAQQHRIPIALTYGMTETAGQIATLKPHHFLQGDRTCGPILPHAHIQITDPHGNPLPDGHIGHITLQTPALALGYHPPTPPPPPHPEPRTLTTDDLGYITPEKKLAIAGRSRDKIITGGENVFAQEVEAAIRATQHVQDICVLGLPDPEWGQIIIAAYIPRHPPTPIPLLKQAIAPLLSPYKHPKHWIALPTLPRNHQGKINYPHLETTLQTHLSLPSRPQTTPATNSPTHKSKITEL